MELLPNQACDAMALQLNLSELPTERIVNGRASAGSVELGRLGEHAIGIWEISPSVSTDIEVDEFFVVLSGEAVVRFADGSPDLHLKPGVVARLAAGAKTTWDVRTKLRKLYLA